MVVVSGGWLYGCSAGRGCRHLISHCSSAVPVILVFQCSAPASTIHHPVVAYIMQSTAFFLAGNRPGPGLFSCHLNICSRKGEGVWRAELSCIEQHILRISWEVFNAAVTVVINFIRV